MTVHHKADSDNVVHSIWAQRQAASCAVASIWMARNQAKQMTFSEGEWSLAWRMYNQVVLGIDFLLSEPRPMTFHPGMHQPDQTTFGNMFSRAGTFMGQVAQALRNDGLKVSQTNFSPGTMVNASFLSDTTPAIVLLGWYQGNQRKGGHFIVASRRTRSGRIVYLDPWGGNLNELGTGPQYPGNGTFEQVIYISA